MATNIEPNRMNNPGAPMDKAFMIQNIPNIITIRAINILWNFPTTNLDFQSDSYIIPQRDIPNKPQVRYTRMQYRCTIWALKIFSGQRSQERYTQWTACTICSLKEASGLVRGRRYYLTWPNWLEKARWSACPEVITGWGSDHSRSQGFTLP